MEKKRILMLLFICSLVSFLNPGRILASSSTPTNLSLSPITNGFLLSWDPAPGDSAVYKIYWGKDDAVSEVNYAGILTTSDTSYEHTGLVPGWTYYYRIMACDCECSQLSGVVSGAYQPSAGGVYTLSGAITVNGVAIQPGMTDPMITATIRAVEVTGANQGNSVGVNPDGTYHMALFPGTYNISVDYWIRESWHGTRINFGSWGCAGAQNISISADTVQNIDMTLHTLTGTVKDADGNPVPDVDLSYGNGSATTSAEAGFEGAYKLYFLAGTYNLTAKPPAGTRFCPISVVADIPGTAPPITLQNQPLLSGTVSVNGIAVQPGMTNPIVTATVRAVEVAGANLGNSVSVNPDGTYQMALLPGTYNISVDYWIRESWHGTWINFGSWGYPGPQNLSFGADTVQNIHMTLYTLNGMARDAAGNPVPDVDLSYDNGTTTTSSESGFEGVYKLYFLAGTYDLAAKPPAGTRFCPVSVVATIPGTALFITFQDQPLLSGTVTVNGIAVQPGMTNPMVTATVRAVEVTSANQGNIAGVNPDGTYQMALLTGTYNIFVDYWIEESWQGASVNSGFWGYPGAQNLSIGADKVQDIDIPLHTLTGTVKDSDDNPASDVELGYSGPYSNGSATTSSEGGFEGTYKLYFLAGTYGIQVTAPPAQYPPFQIKKTDIIGDSTRNIILGNDDAVLSQAMEMMSPNLELHLGLIDVISNNATNDHDIVVSASRDLMQVIINSPGGEMQVRLYRPDGTLYGEYQSGTAPIIVDIQNPETGTWDSEVTAVDIPYDNYPIAIVAGMTPNQPPVADVDGPYSGTVGTPVIFDAGGSHDPDGAIVLYEWDWENDGMFDESSTHPNITHTWQEIYNGTVRLRVTDNEGLIETDCASIEVIDTTPLDIILSVTPDTLWPPNHKMVPVTVEVSDPEAVCSIISVSSNEPQDGRCDGHTAPDWKITGDLTVDLRAERSGAGSGRIYTITVECTDAYENAATATAEVTVPHDLGKKTRKSHHKGGKIKDSSRKPGGRHAKQCETASRRINSKSPRDR